MGIAELENLPTYGNKTDDVLCPYVANFNGTAANFSHYCVLKSEVNEPISE